MNNKEILKLYYNLVENERVVSDKEEYVKLLQSYTEKEEALLNLVENRDNFKEILVELQELEGDMHSIYSREVFIRAFKFGMNLGIEISEKA